VLITIVIYAVVGYGGFHCELKYTSPVIQCQSTACYNGGLCLASNDSSSNITCVCPTGYTGHDCSTKVRHSCQQFMYLLLPAEATAVLFSASSLSFLYTTLFTTIQW